MKEDACCSSPCKKNMGHVIVIVLLVINIIVGISVLCKKDASWNIEEMKVGGADNMALVKQLYNSDVYKTQQKATIEQVLGQFKNGTVPAPTGDTAPVLPTEQAPAVTQ